MGVWNCLNAGWLHWGAQEAELTKDLWRQLTVPVTTLAEMQGYIVTSACISFIFRPEEGQSTWPKRIARYHYTSIITLEIVPSLEMSSFEQPVSMAQPAQPAFCTTCFNHSHYNYVYAITITITFFGKGHMSSLHQVARCRLLCIFRIRCFGSTTDDEENLLIKAALMLWYD